MPGDCHYLEGNVNALRRVEYTQKLLTQIGVDVRRLRMIHLSSAMGHQFAEEATKITEEVRALGPNPLRRTPAPPEATAEAPAPPLEEQMS